MVQVGCICYVVLCYVMLCYAMLYLCAMLGGFFDFWFSYLRLYITSVLVVVFLFVHASVLYLIE
jgi:hypothetical protein